MILSNDDELAEWKLSTLICNSLKILLEEKNVALHARSFLQKFLMKLKHIGLLYVAYNATMEEWINRI